MYSKELTGTQNLWVALFGKISPRRDISERNIPKLLEVLDTLHPRETDVIKRRFGILCDRETQKEIASYYGVSDKRIGQIEDRALRKLRHRARACEIEILYASSEELLKGVRRLKRQRESLKNENVMLRIKLGKLDRAYREARNEVNKLKGRPPRPIVTDFGVNILELTIEKMDLSVRAFNCLKRANINTVTELCRYTEERLKHVRNLGQRSRTEVVEKLESMGLSLAEE